MKKKNKIYLIDVTNRDGVQTSRLGLAKLEKTIINLYLNKMGIFQSEFGFPFANHEKNYLQANLELAKMGVLKPIRLSGWCRVAKEDVIKASEMGVKHINISISTSKQMVKGKFRNKIVRGPEEDLSKPSIIGMMVESLQEAKKRGIETVGINAEDASRTDDQFLIKFTKIAKEEGADRLRYCDTLGYDDPITIYNRIKKITNEVKIPIELHCHNDLGMAVACSITGAKAAIENGVDAYINTTINGMGERAGNADLVSVILALRKSSGFEKLSSLLDERTDLSKAWKIAKYASYAFGVPIPINQTGVGENAFAHESGIHADGALKDRRNYELYDFKELGRGDPETIETGREITTGEYGGIKGFRNVYDKLEIEFKDKEDAYKILELVRYANVHTQKPLTDDELLFIAHYPDQTAKVLTVVPFA